MTDTPLATRPDRSFSVLASAGTGKTWQLVARLTRLLLDGARLDSILAITFTRKAAGEMQQRLTRRLQELLEADDRQLDSMLREIGATPGAEPRRRARTLFEQSLCSEHRLRSTTFHSFCQELLQRFPLEAGLPPGFELAEQTGLLIDESWDALFAEATAAPHTALARALELLFEELAGLHNTRHALLSFVEHRSDWWAFTRQARDPAAFASDHLQRQLELDRQRPGAEQFWNPQTRACLAEFCRLLGQHATQSNLATITALEQVLLDDPQPDQAVDRLTPEFFTKCGERRKRKSSKTQRNKLGAAGEDRLLELHEQFCAELEAVNEQRKRQRTLCFNTAWYRAGQRMLDHFQRIKRERRMLDFADLEWHTFQLLNHPEHAHWIQYKLDQRIDHLLIDEFQDTNPTQWRLILPLLEEMAAGNERRRSLFIVGDAKQSIYRFRRGNPRLLECASVWMGEHLQAERIHLDHSWRSSPAIMDIVNRVFGHTGMQGRLTDFQPHSTHRQELWGQVELWPLIEPQRAATTATAHGLRNPLRQPRPASADRPHYREGQAIAQRIRELVADGIVGYDDVLLLMRSRTHLADYEAALRDQGIPYLSLDRGTLLQSLEIRDLEALLNVLMTPQDNLALAQVLRSPMFSVSDDDLVRLAAVSTGTWIERLQTVSAQMEADHPLSRAGRLIDHWRSLAGHLPIHDLLERIFHEANLLQRYQAAFPDTQVARVRANLTRFIGLALEVDAGRYPSLPRFLERVRQLRNLEKEGPSQAAPEAEGNERVRLLTIHAAKGLEAPLVFLVDAAAAGSSPPGRQTLVRWPADADRPSDFMLLANTRQRDSISRDRHALEQQEERIESANLLYVAMTRARNMLVVSGCAPSGGGRSLGWYGQIAVAVRGPDEDPASVWRHTYQQAVAAATAGRVVNRSATGIDPRLSQPIPIRPLWREIAPSRSVTGIGTETGDPLGRARGVAIHRMLQLATDCRREPPGADEILQRVAGEAGLTAGDPLLLQWWDEVARLMSSEELSWLFHPVDATRSFNEIPIQYRQEQKTVFGIVDRLLVTECDATLIDYKTHRIDAESRLQALSAHYQPQLDLYRQGLQRLWPEHRVTTYLLFTDGGQLVKC